MFLLHPVFLRARASIGSYSAY